MLRTLIVVILVLHATPLGVEVIEHVMNAIANPELARNGHQTDPEHGCTSQSHRCSCCQAPAVLALDAEIVTRFDEQRVASFVRREPAPEPEPANLLRPPIG